MFCAFLAAFPASVRAQTFAIGDSSFLLNGKPFQILSGEMHYARIPPEYWRDRLMKVKSMGLNTVATYVFWNVHEPKPGKFVFSGGADVAKFIKTAQEVGLYVILRPGPYACAEWDFGGYPSWLLEDRSMTIRTGDQHFLAACRGYLRALASQVGNLQVTHGGPILMVQVENEYGSYGKDTAYIASLRDMLREVGFDVPLFNADGPSQLPNACVSGVFPGVNGATGEEIYTALKRYRPRGPFFVPEFYPGWLDHWGEPHASVDAVQIAKQLSWIVSHGVSVSIYMVHGGTNFGFMNGANYGGHYQPQPTSYDYDAPIDEAGGLTPKYFALREAILSAHPEPASIPPSPEGIPLIEIPPTDLHRAGSIESILPSPINSEHVQSMEDLHQSYGYILYRTSIPSSAETLLTLHGLADYATIYLDGNQVGSLDRRYHQKNIILHHPPSSSRLDILVENGGRINYGRELVDNRKGITDSVTLGGMALHNWQIHTLPMDAPSAYQHASPAASGLPSFYEGTITIDTVGDTFLDMSGWGKGFVAVNGHNLGRYWSIGPQQTLYLPGVWLKKGTNTIDVFAMEEGETHTIIGLRHSILDVLGKDKLKPVPPARAAGPLDFPPSKMVAQGTFNAGDDEQDVVVPATDARFVCLQTLSSARNDHFASASEIFLLDEGKRVLPRDGWKIYYVDSEELDSEDGHAENVLDGDRESIWHTQWGSAQPDHPHALVLDLGKIVRIGGFRYVARQGNAPGKIKEYRIYMSAEPFEKKR